MLKKIIMSMKKECLMPLPQPGTFTVYYRPGCPYSLQAIRLLQNLRLREMNGSGGVSPCLMSYKTATGCPVPFRAYNVEAIMETCFGGDKNAFIDYLNQKTDKKGYPSYNTFPLVFDPKGKFLGGFTQLQELIAVNNLEPSSTLLTQPIKPPYPWEYSGSTHYL